MKPFEDINTELPYKETDEYVEGLIARCSGAAVRKDQLRIKSERHSHRPWLYGVVSIAAAIVIAVYIWRPNHSSSSLSPIYSFFLGLTQGETQNIFDWRIDEIPEFYK